MLGKVAVPKPVNLPSQRLENRGLDPNVEIVPKGTLSWRTTGRSPPASGSAWGSATFSSSPPASAGAWGRLNVSTARPSSGGSGTRPSTAGSDQSHEAVTPNAWGSTSSRPSSASGALGLAHSQLTVTRPCSAESRTCSSQLSRFADSSVESGGPWGGSGLAHKLGDNQPQPAHFNLTSVDFPTLGCNKNPDLRPQQGNASTIRSMPSSEVLAQKERPHLSPTDWSEGVSTGTPVGQDRGTADTWKRESASYPQEIPRPDEGQPQREGSHRQPFVSSDSWHCDDGHTASMTSNLSEDEWHRGGPPVGPYGPPAGHGRFPFNSPSYMRPPFEYGPLPFAQGQPGPGGYSRHGEMYRPYVAQPMVPGQPGLSRGHGMYSNQLPYDGYYGPPGVTGPHYGSAVDEREMAMIRMGGPSLHGGYPQNQGRHLDGPRFRRGGPGSGPRPVPFHHTLSREHNDPSAYNRVAFEVTDKDLPKQIDFRVPKDMDNSSDNNHMFFSHESNIGINSAASTNRQNEGNNPRGASSGHCDWGTISSDEPMDFSKPVFDDGISRRGFADNNSSGIENNHERRANIPRVVEEPRLGDNMSVQVQIKDGVDSCNSSAAGNLNQLRNNKFVEVDTQKVTLLEDQFLVGQENQWEVSVLSKDEKKNVSRLADDKVHEEDIHFGDTGASAQKVDTSGRNHRIVERAQTLMTSPKAPDQQGLLDGSKRVSVASASSSERYSGLNTSVKLQGGLSSAAGSNNASFETLKVRDKVQLLKRSDNHPTGNVLDTEGAVEKVQSAQGGKGTPEPLEREGQTMKARFKVYEGDNEWRRKVPTTEPIVKEMKANITTSSHAIRQVVASVPGSGDTPVSESVDNKSAWESHTQQSHGSHDYEAQRARMKEIALQRFKQLQKEEEERTKEQKAKALAKLEELNRRAATSQEVGNSKGETISSGPVVYEAVPVVYEAVQQEQAIGSQNKNSELLHIAPDKMENVPGAIFAEGNCITNEDERSRPHLKEQNGLLKEGDTLSDSDAIQVSDVAAAQGNFGKNDVCDIPINVGKNDKGKRTNNVSKEDLKHQIKMDEQKGRVKERGSPNTTALNEAPVITMQDTKVSASALTQTSEALQTDVPVPESDSSRNADQHQQPGYPKQTRTRQKTKQQYVPEQKSSSFQPSTLEKTGQLVVPISGNTVKSVGENDGLHMSSSSMFETSMPLSIATTASGSDGAPVARKKKNNRNVKSKHKIDRQGINIGSVGSSEHDISMSTPINSVGGDSKHGVENVTSNSIKGVNNDVDMQNEKSEFTSVGAGGNDVNVAHDTPGDQEILQSKDDASAGRMPHFKSQFAKRSYRGSQDLRASEKSQGNEGMVWTPVRVVNPNVMSIDKQKLDQTGVEVQPSGVSNEVVIQNPVKNRRAEMERYVPKPIAKEQAQIHENCHQHAASPVSTQVQTDQSSTQQGTAKGVGIAETRQQHSSFGENKGHLVGNKHAKQNVSWRQRNSSEISKSHKGSHVQESVEVHSAASIQIDEVTLSKALQSHVETQDPKSEGIGNQPKSDQPDMYKTRCLEQLPKATAVPANKQEGFHSETAQKKQLATLPHLQTSNIAKDEDSQMASKREQNMQERFYQANRSRSKSNKFSFRPVHMEGNHQISKFEGKNDELEKTHPTEQIYPHQRPRSSGSWTPKQQGLSDNKEHFSQSISVGQIEIGQIKIGSLEEYGGFQRQSAQQIPSNSKGDAHQQEGQSLSAKQQHVQNYSSQQLHVSPHQLEHKNQGPSHDVVRLETDHMYQQQSKPTNLEKQAIEREQHKQATNSSSYQQRRVSSGQGHWQQTGANYGVGIARRTDSHEHPRATVVQSRKQQATTIPRASESSPGAGRHERQDMNNQQAPIEIPKRQNPQGHSQPFSNQKPQEFYQPKAGSASGDNEKHEISHSTASRSGSSWTGDHRTNHQYRDRDHNSERRGRSGRNGGGLVARRNESESKSERLSNQRLVVDATGGAIPHQVAG